MKSQDTDSKKKDSMNDSMRNFLLSLLATTISIALTFGTAAIIEKNKDKQDKHEIVMMLMYDMCNSLKSIEKSDSMIVQSLKLQKQMAEDTTLYAKLNFQLAFLMPKVEYTEATEHIFSSSIETINKVDNVLFTENVAKFYQYRRMYKTNICDSVYNVVNREESFKTLKGALDFDYFFYAAMARSILSDMHKLFIQCKNMTDISDEELEAYRKEREQIDETTNEDVAQDTILGEIINLQRDIMNAKEKHNLQ